MRGEKIGVIGKNGSGKSTFLNLASQKIIDPQCSSVKFVVESIFMVLIDIACK